MVNSHFKGSGPTADTHASLVEARARHSLTTIVAILLLCAAGAIPPALAEELIVRSISGIESGTLLFEADSRSHYIRAPLVDTSVNISVQGLLAGTTVHQTFTNDSSEWVEGVYVFPLPDDATVDELTMVIGETRIDGVIQARKKAKKTYSTAKRTGKKATLLEQQRANLFTARVANIPPGETVSIEIGYQTTIRYSDGQFSLMFPLTITPRYLPGTAMQYANRELIADNSSGWATPGGPVADAGEITPPMTTQAAPVSIDVMLDTGLPGLTISSSTHDIISTPAETTGNQTGQPLWNITLANSSVPADRDFKLSWTPQPGIAPVAAVFRQDKQLPKGSESFASLMLMPPQQIFNNAIPQREVIFVIDTSNSMSGNSIARARSTLTLGIERLTSRDTFNVIEFDNSSSKFFRHAVNADDANKKIAIDRVRRLSADGGTEILGAMALALNNSRDIDSPTAERIRQIVFITDGSVGNEEEIFRYVKQNIGTSRLFTVGIGSAPNTWFMRKSAELGKGTYTHIANASEIADKTLALLAKLERPALTDVKLSFNTATTPEVYPAIIPDVYMGEPVLADARWVDKLEEGDVEVSGIYAGRKWTQQIKLGSLENQTGNTGLDKLWAYRKIQSLEDALLHNTNPAAVEEAITGIALNYSLVTKYTSLVAVEDAVSRDPLSANLKTASVPNTMAAGNTMQYPQGSLGTTLRFLISLLLALLVVLFALPRLRQPDTSVVCTVLRKESR